jgi:pimeloyl-ACP methyl ester carboxylesterase
MRIVTGLLTAGLAIFCAQPGRAASAEGEQMVEAGGYTLNVNVTRGSNPNLPVVILEAGGGWDSSQWKTLQPDIAAQTGATVVSYDRPGYGKSPLPDKPYDIVAETEAFHAALDKLGLARSVIAVGHSYGGFLIQLYANRWPATIKGLLFLDPNNPAAMLAMGEDANQKPVVDPKTPRDRANARVDRAGRKPFEAVYAAPLPQTVPVIVVTAEKAPFPKPRQVQIFKLSHQLMAASVEDGKLVVAEGSNHMIPAQRPDIVLSSVRELLAKAK